jgi:hypothetical protein
MRVDEDILDLTNEQLACLITIGRMTVNGPDELRLPLTPVERRGIVNRLMMMEAEGRRRVAVVRRARAGDLEAAWRAARV